jgi:lysozyme
MPTPRASRIVAIAASGGILAGTAALLGDVEGLKLSRYLDIIGKPTICIGETDPRIVNGGPYTKPQCLAILKKRLPQYDAELLKCIRREMPTSVHISMLSGTYNFGADKMCKSSMVSLINAGNFHGACEALHLYTQAGGRFSQGLVNRREYEIEVCEADLESAP